MTDAAKKKNGPRDAIGAASRATPDAYTVVTMTDRIQIFVTHQGNGTGNPVDACFDIRCSFAITY